MTPLHPYLSTSLHYHPSAITVEAINDRSPLITPSLRAFAKRVSSHLFHEAGYENMLMSFTLDIELCMSYGTALSGHNLSKSGPWISSDELSALASESEYRSVHIISLCDLLVYYFQVTHNATIVFQNHLHF